MKPLQECFLSDVRVSKEVRHFGGVVNESDNFTFYRFFGILLKQEALEQFEELGWPVRYKRTKETRQACKIQEDERNTAGRLPRIPPGPHRLRHHRPHHHRDPE